jgi:hypothetical protein
MDDAYLLAVGIIALTGLFFSVFRLIIQAFDGLTRSVTVRVFNGTHQSLTGSTVFFYSGTSDVIPPDELQRQGELRYSARKTRGPVARGAVGVVTFETENGNTVAILFSVPFDYTFYRNWWNVEIYQGQRRADSSMYRRLYYSDSALKGNDEWQEIKDNRVKFGIEVRGVMSSSGNSTLHVHLLEGRLHRGAPPLLIPPHLSALQFSSLTPTIQLGVSVLDTILESLSDVLRTIAIGVSNRTGATWKAKNVYFFSGTSDVVLPDYVADGQTFLYSGRKTRGPIARGVVGVLAYDTSRGETLGVLFSVPFDYNFFSNQWNVGLFEGNVKANMKMYKALWQEGTKISGKRNKSYEALKESTLKKGDNCWTSGLDIGNGYIVSGVMSSSGTPTLKIIIENPQGRQHLTHDNSIQ